MIKEIKQLNDTFYKIFDDLKEAKPSLAGCDEAFISISKKILEQYELEYKLLDLKCRVDTEREIAKLEGRYDRLVPQRWKTRFLHRKKQNYAATLIDIEADEAAGKFFAECERRRAKERLAAAQEVEVQAGIDDEFEIVEEGTDGAEAPTDGIEQAEDQPSGGDEPFGAESDPRNATSSSSPPCGEMSSNFPDTKSPRTDNAKAKKSQKGDKKNVREGDQAG